MIHRYSSRFNLLKILVNERVYFFLRFLIFAALKIDFSSRR